MRLLEAHYCFRLSPVCSLAFHLVSSAKLTIRAPTEQEKLPFRDEAWMASSAYNLLDFTIEQKLLRLVEISFLFVS